MTPQAEYGILGFTTTTRSRTAERSHLLSFMVRSWAQRAKFTDVLALEALEQVLPHAVLQAAAREADCPTQRRRKLPAPLLSRQES